MFHGKAKNKPLSSNESHFIYILLLSSLYQTTFIFMGLYGSIIFLSTITLSGSFFFAFTPIFRQRRRAIEKLKLVNEALVAAEENVARLQERHDVILKEICSYYLVNSELQEALVAARADIDVASGFVIELRRLQLNLLNSLS